MTPPPEPVSFEHRLPAGAAVRVLLVKPTRRDLSYDATMLFDNGDHIVVTAPFARTEPLELGYVTFDLGDQFTEHYWRSRWYSIKEVRRGNLLKGWYCDIARPACVNTIEIRSLDLDLDLDVWIDAATGAVLPLDEDEFAASGIADHDPAAAAAADAFATLLGLSRTQLEQLITLSD